jgi:hypothetical protein
MAVERFNSCEYIVALANELGDSASAATGLPSAYFPRIIEYELSNREA